MFFNTYGNQPDGTNLMYSNTQGGIFDATCQQKYRLKADTILSRSNIDSGAKFIYGTIYDDKIYDKDAKLIDLLTRRKVKNELTLANGEKIPRVYKVVDVHVKGEVEGPLGSDQSKSSQLQSKRMCIQASSLRAIMDLNNQRNHLNKGQIQDRLVAIAESDSDAVSIEFAELRREG